MTGSNEEVANGKLQSYLWLVPHALPPRVADDMNDDLGPGARTWHTNDWIRLRTGDENAFARGNPIITARRRERVRV